MVKSVRHLMSHLMSPPFSVAHEYDGTALTPGAEIVDSFYSGRGRRGVRRCPNRHKRWLAEEPPLLSWLLPGPRLFRPGERAG